MLLQLLALEYATRMKATLLLKAMYTDSKVTKLFLYHVKHCLTSTFKNN